MNDDLNGKMPTGITLDFLVLWISSGRFRWAVLALGNIDDNVWNIQKFTKVFQPALNVSIYISIDLLKTLNSYLRTLEYLLSCVSKPLLKCQSMITEKILRIVSLVNDSIAITLKWRKNLEVISLRPPPGGPIAATKSRSTMLIVEVSFLFRES